MTRRSRRASQNKRTRSTLHPDHNYNMPENEESPAEQADDEGYLDDDEGELEECPYCGRFLCVCDSVDGDLDSEENRYLDKRLSDREDFHSDESVGPVDIEPYYPEY